jgi:hypothetical protein
MAVYASTLFLSACLLFQVQLLSASSAVFEREPLTGAAEEIETKRQVFLWTDDYSDLYRILK